MKSNPVTKAWIVGWLMAASLGPAAASDSAAPPQKVPLNPLTQARYVGSMQRGKIAYDRHELAASEKEFRRALELRPSSAEALNDLGDAQYRSGRFAEAQKSFEQAGADPQALTRSQAAYQAGNSLYRQNRLPEAAAEYRKALGWNEQDEDARFNLQVVLDKLKAEKPRADPKQGKDKSSSSQAGSGGDKDRSGKPDQARDKSSGSRAGSGSDEAKNKDKSGQPDQANSKARQDQAAKGQPQQQANQDASEAPRDKQPANPDGTHRTAQTTPGQQKQPQAGQAGAQHDDTDRILQYYQNKERQAKRRPAAPSEPIRPSEETW